MRRNSWQDGVLGTNCPIPSNWKWDYQFQVKDQIGSFFYFPSLNFQRAAGGFGSFIITNRPVISLPFAAPDGDIILLIGDWYTQNHTVSTHILGSESKGKFDHRIQSIMCVCAWILGSAADPWCWKRPWDARWSSHQWEGTLQIQHYSCTRWHSIWNSFSWAR